MKVVHRHWIRGLAGGLLLGLGLALGTVIYGITALGPWTPWAALGVGLLIGIILVFVPAIRGGRTRPPAYVDTGTYGSYNRL